MWSCLSLCPSTLCPLPATPLPLSPCFMLKPPPPHPVRQGQGQGQRQGSPPLCVWSFNGEGNSASLSAGAPSPACLRPCSPCSKRGLKGLLPCGLCLVRDWGQVTFQTHTSAILSSFLAPPSTPDQKPLFAKFLMCVTSVPHPALPPLPHVMPQRQLRICKYHFTPHFRMTVSKQSFNRLKKREQ